MNPAQKVVKRRPVLLGYIAAIVTITLAWQIAEALGWVR